MGPQWVSFPLTADEPEYPRRRSPHRRATDQAMRNLVAGLMEVAAGSLPPDHPICQQARTYLEATDPVYVRVRQQQPFEEQSVLDQSEWWLPRGAHAWVRLVNMTPAHQMNLLSFLRKRAMAYHMAASMREWGCFDQPPRGDMAEWHWEQACDIAGEEFDRSWPDPYEWMEERPLVRRLVDLVLAHGEEGDGNRG